MEAERPGEDLQHEEPSHPQNRQWGKVVTQSLGSNPHPTCETEMGEDAEQGCRSPVGSKGSWSWVCSKAVRTNMGTGLRGHSIQEPGEMRWWGCSL